MSRGQVTYHAIAVASRTRTRSGRLYQETFSLLPSILHPSLPPSLPPHYTHLTIIRQGGRPLAPALRSQLWRAFHAVIFLGESCRSRSRGRSASEDKLGCAEAEANQRFFVHDLQERDTAIFREEDLLVICRHPTPLQPIRQPTMPSCLRSRVAQIPRNMTASPILKSESVNNIFSFNESALPNGLQNALHSTTLLKTAAKSGITFPYRQIIPRGVSYRCGHPVG